MTTPEQGEVVTADYLLTSDQPIIIGGQSNGVLMQCLLNRALTPDESDALVHAGEFEKLKYLSLTTPQLEHYSLRLNVLTQLDVDGNELLARPDEDTGFFALHGTLFSRGVTLDRQTIAKLGPAFNDWVQETTGILISEAFYSGVWDLDK